MLLDRALIWFMHLLFEELVKSIAVPQFNHYSSYFDGSAVPFRVPVIDIQTNHPTDSFPRSLDSQCKWQFPSTVFGSAAFLGTFSTKEG